MFSKELNADQLRRSDRGVIERGKHGRDWVRRWVTSDAELRLSRAIIVFSVHQPCSCNDITFTSSYVVLHCSQACTCTIQCAHPSRQQRHL